MPFQNTYSFSSQPIFNFTIAAGSRTSNAINVNQRSLVLYSIDILSTYTVTGNTATWSLYLNTLYTINEVQTSFNTYVPGEQMTSPARRFSVIIPRTAEDSDIRGSYQLYTRGLKFNNLQLELDSAVPAVPTGETLTGRLNFVSV